MLKSIPILVAVFFSNVLGGLNLMAQPQEFALWPAGLPTGSVPLPESQLTELRGKPADEHLYLIEDPTITVFPAGDKANGCGVVIFPGGGYNVLAWEKEGTEIAEWFNSLGVTAGVVKYRVPRRGGEGFHREPLQDGQRAIRWLRHHAQQYRLDPERIGVLGFSAGGHLAIMTGVCGNDGQYESRDEIDRQSARPSFICPIYPAYLGDDYQDDRPELGDLAKVDAETPPTFLSVTADDKMRGAQAALWFVELQKAGVTAELHVFARGGHGYGIRGDAPASRWNQALEAWLRTVGFLQVRPAKD